jgi:hypothetical protein
VACVRVALSARPAADKIGVAAFAEIMIHIVENYPPSAAARAAIIYLPATL